jgi:hypothetical protein
LRISTRIIAVIQICTTLGRFTPSSELAVDTKLLECKHNTYYLIPKIIVKFYLAQLFNTDLKSHAVN